MNYDLWKESIYSDGTALFVSNGNPKVGEEIEISLRVIKASPVEEVYIRYLLNGEEIVKKLSLKEVYGGFQYYAIKVKMANPVFQYYFIICTHDEMYFYNQQGVFDYVISEERDFKIICNFDKPQWTETAVFYQIFVDRFCNGDEKNDIKDNEYSYNGFSTSKINWNEPAGEYNKYGNLDFYGGDLQGVASKIPYLKDLGVNALYLNPIFSAPSNHKYDCSDYYNVDEHFGGNSALAELTAEAHKDDMKLILDISINHTGDSHSWFKNKKAYYFTGENGSYECWCGVKSLPVLNYSNESLRNEMIFNDNSILKKWIKQPYNIDGWRFDVGHNVGKMNNLFLHEDLWKNIRKELKKQNREAFILAEHWTDASDYLQGECWDSTMNYFGFERPVRKYLGETDWYFSWKVDRPMKVLDSYVFINEVQQYYSRLPYQIQSMQFNLLSSHDIHRIHHSKSISRENLKTAIVMLMTFLGVPCIYYGDEIGIDGSFGTNEGARYPMTWQEEKWDKEINKLYRYMIKLRKKENVLKAGSFKFLPSDREMLVYARFDKKTVILFINSQSKNIKEITIPLYIVGQYKELNTLYGNEGSITAFDNKSITVTLKAQETLLLKLSD